MRYFREFRNACLCCIHRRRKKKEKIRFVNKKIFWHNFVQMFATIPLCIFEHVCIRVGSSAKWSGRYSYFHRLGCWIAGRRKSYDSTNKFLMKFLCEHFAVGFWWFFFAFWFLIYILSVHAITYTDQQKFALTFVAALLLCLSLSLQFCNAILARDMETQNFIINFPLLFKNVAFPV